MIWERRCPIHGERAKPIDRAAVAAHFDCCVLCVVCVFVVVFCVWEQLLATKLVESQHRPRQNGQLLHTNITKIGHQTPQIKLDVPTPHHSEMLYLFELIGSKQCGPCYECAKRVQKFS